MPSTYSSRLRLNFQAPGDNLNTWGLVLNTDDQLLEDAIAKRVAFALSGPKTLTTANGADDEARGAFLDVTSGSGGAITIPAVEKLYAVRNGASGDVSITTGGATNATVKPGEVGWVVSDGANVRRVQFTDYLGGRITGVGTPVNSTDAVTKGYADALAFNAVALPGQGPGTIGQFIRSDGTNAGWATVAVTDVTGAAPLSAPSFTGGVTVAGGLTVAGGVTQTGGSVSNVTAIAALDIDFSANDAQTKSISSNSTFTFSGFVSGKAQGVIVKLIITSSAVPTWPASVVHPGGVNPSASLGNGTHYLGLVSLNGGTQVLLVVLGRNVS